jgi:hypothetical protein
MQYEQEVKRGAKLLDEKVPGWREKIALEKLNLQFADCCILGQTFGNAYEDVVKETLGFECISPEGRYHGFDVGDGEYLTSPLYDVLTESWKEFLSKPTPHTIKRATDEELEALNQLLEGYKEFTNDAGPCDHSVNICVCECYRIIEQATNAMRTLSGQLPLCGTCRRELPAHHPGCPESAESGGCPKCGQSFFSHNDDGSCVED